MGLLASIEATLKEAMREKSEVKRDAVRSLLTAIKVKEKDLRRVPDDAEIQGLISTLIKQRRDAAEQYRQGKREELAAREEAEIVVLQVFLPAALSDAELEALVNEAIAEAGAVSAKEMGRVMKALMPKIAGRAEGKRVNDMVKTKLS